MKFKRGIVLAAALSVALGGVYASTADYPNKSITMIIAFTAGGSSDVQARLMQKYWNAKGYPHWIFVYKTGAGGAIGFTELAHAKPDGYTIGGINVPHIVLQPMVQSAQYNISDFAYICQVVNDPQVVAVRKDSKFKSVKEIVDFAKKNPEKLKVGLVGPYSGHHLMMLDFKNKYKIDVADIMYKGAADQNAALLGGEIEVMFGNVNDVMRSLEQIRVLGVASEKRNSFLLDVPTLKEQGYDIESDIRRGYAAPKGITPAILKYLRDAFKAVATDPAYIKDMKKAGQPAEYMPGEAFEKFVRQESERDTELLKTFGLLKK
jgi:tripartite-type tricarboxylate transporter receptor subunit TctC